MTETTPKHSEAHKSKRLTIERIYTTPGVHPYDEVAWEKRDVEQQNWKTGEGIFSQQGVEFPDVWPANAPTIVTTKYFRGAVGTPPREHTVKQLVDLVVLAGSRARKQHGYFNADGLAVICAHAPTASLLHQHFAFITPVGVHVGTSAPRLVSACFILSVDDPMDSIRNFYKE